MIAGKSPQDYSYGKEHTSLSMKKCKLLLAGNRIISNDIALHICPEGKQQIITGNQPAIKKGNRDMYQVGT